MALVYLEASEPNAVARAQMLASELGLSLERVGGESLKLIVSSTALSLGFVDKKRGKPYFVDFQTAAWKARFAHPLSRHHIFRRALGVHEEPLSVLDLTAGFGQDAMMALSLGCRVDAVERSPIVAALLRDGVARAQREDETMAAHLARFSLMVGDSLELLPKLVEGGGLRAASVGVGYPDVIYLDPMFAKPKTSAKSPKEMQLLQELLPATPAPAATSTAPSAATRASTSTSASTSASSSTSTSAAEEEVRLLTLARQYARQRVVVKRPLKARAGLPPSHSFKGQSIRYDIYLSK